LHDRTDLVGWQHEVDHHHRLFDAVIAVAGQFTGGGDLDGSRLDGAILLELVGRQGSPEIDHVGHRRSGLHHIEVEFAFQALLADLHMQHAEESAAEAMAEGATAFGRPAERGIVERELLDRLTQLVIGRFTRGIQPAVDHRLHLPEPRQWQGLGILEGDGVADLDIGEGLDRRADETDLARAEAFRSRDHLRPQASDIADLVGLGRADQADAVALVQAAVFEADIEDDAPIIVIDGIEDQGLGAVTPFASWRRDAFDHGLEDLRDADPLLGACSDGQRAVQCQRFLDFGANEIGPGAGQVDLVEGRDDDQVLLDSEEVVGHRLCLHALRCVHHQQASLARLQRARHFIAEIDVSRRIDEVELVELAILVLVPQADGLGLDGDATFALEIHPVEHREILVIALLHCSRRLEQALGQGALAVIDVGDDAEVADEMLGMRHIRVRPDGEVQRGQRVASQAPEGARRGCAPSRTEGTTLGRRQARQCLTRSEIGHITRAPRASWR